jgi:hypothetical protein
LGANCDCKTQGRQVIALDPECHRLRIAAEFRDDLVTAFLFFLFRALA